MFVDDKNKEITKYVLKAGRKAMILGQYNSGNWCYLLFMLTRIGLNFLLLHSNSSSTIAADTEQEEIFILLSEPFAPTTID